MLNDNCVNYNREVLGSMNDNDVITALVQTRSSIDINQKSNKSTWAFEVEYCYIQDEIQKRARYNDRFRQFVSNTHN